MMREKGSDIKAPLLLLIVLAVIQTFVAAQTLTRPRVLTDPIKAVLGASLNITCSGATTGVKEYKWLKDFTVLWNETGPSLFVPVLTVDDAGTYMCWYSIGSSQSSISFPFGLYLTPPDRPSLDMHSNNDLITQNQVPYVLAGHSVRFSCNFLNSDLVGENFRSFTFYKENQELESTSGNSLDLKNITKERSGQYTCTAKNSVGESQKSNAKELIVVEPPVLTTNLEDPKKGEALNLFCDPKIPPSPDYRITWLRNENILQHETDKTLNISPLGLEDEGDYACVLDFRSRPSSGKSVIFSVVFSPPLEATLTTGSVLYGQRVQLDCFPNSMRNYGILRSSLYFDDAKIGEHISRGGSTFYTEYVRYRASGKYSCTVSNRRGESAHSEPQQMVVQEWHAATRDLTRSTVLAMARYTYLDCGKNRVTPHPHRTAQYCSLYFNNQLYLQDQDCNFRLPHALSGKYTCTASSFPDASTTSAQSAPMSRQFIGKPVIRPKTNDPPEIGKPYTLICDTDTHGLNIYWYKGYSSTTVYSRSKDLTFEPLASQNNGIYRCDVHGMDDTVVTSDSIYFIFEKAKLQAILKSDQETLYPFGTSNTFRCSGSNSQGYSLYKDGVQVGSYRTGGATQVLNSGTTNATFTCRTHSLFEESDPSGPVYVYPAGTVQIELSTPFPILGQGFTLTCTTNLLHNVTYKWNIFRIDLDDNEYGLRSFAEGQVLTFDPVKQDDAGLYICMATNGNDERATAETDQPYLITFSAPPVPNLYKNSNSEVAQQFETSGDTPSNLQAFHCNCIGVNCDYTDAIRLYRNDQLVSDIPYTDEVNFWSSWYINRYYIVNGSEPTSHGNYTCTTINYYGESEHSAQVTIGPASTSSVELATIISDNPDSSLGEDIVLTCNVKTSVTDEQVLDYQWERNFRNMFVQGRTLTLTSVTEDDHALYSCVYMNRTRANPYGRSWKSQPIAIIFLRPLKPNLFLQDARFQTSGFNENSNNFVIFGPGDRMVFGCQSNFRDASSYLSYGHTTNLYSLYVDGQVEEVDIPFGVFNMTAKTIGDYIYTCQAKNRMGTSEFSWPLTVKVQDRPVLTSGQIRLGHDLTLTCETNEKSTGWDITWKKNGQTMSPMSPTITLESVTPYDEGRYTCQHKDGVWVFPESDGHVIQPLERAATPEIYTWYHIRTFESGKQIMINCLSSSTTSTSATFWKAGKAVYEEDRPLFDDGSQIVFHHTIVGSRVSNSGEYTCTVTNSKGESLSSEPIMIEVVGIDECANSTCEQICQNTIGGYLCLCDSGYRLTKEGGRTCSDINECNEQHECEQICMNKIGGYTCDCEEGYTLKDDLRTCLHTDNASACATSDCDHICVMDADNMPMCRCRLHYKLKRGSTTVCEDIDECKSDNNICDQLCTNTDGGFTCSCHIGFQLQFDNTTCEKCEAGRHGYNCEQTCLCSGQARNCDHVTGCQCFPGYTGSSCESDINECDDDVCGVSKVCVNTPGSYICQCLPGFIRADGDVCVVDKDECADVLDNDCDAADNEVCRNTPRNYSCDCAQGFKKSSDLLCVDINECSNQGINPCQQTCTNSPGSFKCSCASGYLPDESDSSKCIYVFIKGIELVFPNLNFPPEFFNSSNSEYKSVKANIQKEMRKRFKRDIVGFLNCLIPHMFPGSLIVEAKIVIDPQQNSNPGGDVVKAVTDQHNFANITVRGHTQSIFVRSGHTVINSTLTQCEVRRLIDPCASDQICREDNRGMSQCNSVDDPEDKTRIYIIVGITAGVVFAIIIVVTVLLRRRSVQNKGNSLKV